MSFPTAHFTVRQEQAEGRMLLYTFTASSVQGKHAYHPQTRSTTVYVHKGSDLCVCVCVKCLSCAKPETPAISFFFPSYGITALRYHTAVCFS